MIQRGERLERGGVLDEALKCYVAAERTSDASIRAEAVRRQADIQRLRCDWDAAVALARRSLELAREAGLDERAAEALNALAAIEQSRGRNADAASLYREALELAAEPRNRGCVLQNLGAIAALDGDHAEAQRWFEESLACFHAAGYERGVAIALNNIGRAHLESGELQAAEEVLGRAVAQARYIADLDLSSVVLVNLAETLARRNELSRAEEEASAALGFFKVSGNRWRQIECLKIIGDIRLALGETEVARRLYAQALAVASEIGDAAEAEALARRVDELGEAAEPPRTA